MKRLRRTALAVVAGGLLAAGPATACDFLSGVPCEKTAQIRDYRAQVFAEVAASVGEPGSEDRARALVQSVLQLKANLDSDKASHFIDYSGLPAGTELIGVEFAYDEPFAGDREIRIQLDLPKSFVNSKDFDEPAVARIGAEFLQSIATEDWNRVFLDVRDPSTGEVVDVQELLPKEKAPRRTRPVDAESDRISAELGIAVPKSSVPTINPGQPSGSLGGKTIYINQSHGWFDDVDFGRWRVQRGDNFGVLEDFDSAEIMNMYVLPALRNAGAKVQTVRESDLQTNMVIVDNADGTSGNDDGTYVETGTWSNSSLNGFVQKTTSSWVGTSVNPFNQGSGANRLSNGVTSGTPTATATWTVDVPEDGYYNVYTSWTAYTARADDAQYLVHHSGGVSEVRMNQKIDGYTWNLLGNWYFEAGAPASESKVVLTNNSSDGTASNVSADAVRWGGGMGDMERHNHGISGRPRWEEEAVNYLQFNGFGYSGSLYTGNDDEAGGWSDRPQYARWEHSEKDNSVEDALYFAWHTNAFNGSARGLSTFRHSTATQASADLQSIMHDELYDHIEGQWFSNWTVRSKNVTNFGENNQSSLGTGLPGFLIEGLFHDNADDAGGYAEPQFRHDMARAIVHGLIAYYEDRDSVTLTLPPETPTHLRVTALGSGQVHVAWDAPPTSSSNQYYGDAATSYRVQSSDNGFGFDDGTVVSSGTSTTFSGLTSGETKYYRVVAVNAGGQSFPTETLAVCDGASDVLIVNGFDRNSASLVPQQSITNAGTNLQRLDPRTFQAFNYVIEHAEALEGTGVAISSASNEAVIDGDVTLGDYDAVFWICGEESTVLETFSSAEQALVSSYLASSGNNLFVSGAEIGWDLGRSTRPQADQDFYNDVLRASYVGDDSNTYDIASTGSGPFAGVGAFSFDVAGGARYDAEYPDRLGTSSGSSVALSYSGGTGGTAAVYRDGTSRVITLGFPFELVNSASVRSDLMEAVVDFFDLSADTTAPSAPTGLAATPGDGSVGLDWSDNGEGDLDGYNVYRSTTSGSGYSKINGSLVASSAYTDNSASNFTTYYYVVTAVDTSANESGNSSQVSATPEDTTAPSAPTGLAATPGDGSVGLDWNDNGEGDLDGYNVYRSTTSGSGYSKINGSLVASSAYTDNTASNFTTYYYVVTAVDDTPNANESGNSSQVSATPEDTTAPSAPTGLAATPGDGSVGLDWSDNGEGDLDGYNVYRSTTSGSGYSKINGSLVASSAYTDNTASNFTTYYYVVTAVDDTPNANESGNSSQVSATPEDTTAPSAPTGLAATPGDGSVGLDWNDNGEGDLDGYNVYRSTTSGSGYSKINGSLVASSAYTDNSAANDTTYYYVVTAVDDTPNANESANSSQVSATPVGSVPANAIDFDDFTVGSYGSQDVNSTSWAKHDGGTTLELTGNTWKTISLNYDVTASTVIEFDYRSTGNEPEIGGVCFDNDTTLSSDQTWKVFGTQAYGVTTYDDYTGTAWKHYTIPVGQTLTAGSYTYLVFLNDMDSGSGANSWFRNVVVYDTQTVFDNDNGSPEYTETGAWALSGSSGYDGGTYRYASAGTARTATWDLDLPVSGSWTIEVMFRASSNRSDSVQYEVATSSGTQTVTADQTQNNLVWVTLGTWDFDANGGSVTLDAADSSTPGVVISDAVRATYVP